MNDSLLHDGGLLNLCDPGLNALPFSLVSLQLHATAGAAIGVQPGRRGY